MPPAGPSRELDRTFRVSVTLKGLDGALEVIGGVLLLLVSPGTVERFAQTLTQHELSQDPHDFIASHLLHSAQGLSKGATAFAAIYLLSHGVAKVVLVAAVLRDQTWAYPGMIALLVTFIVYQLYRIAEHVSVGLILLTAFDAFVVVLTWKEYRAKHASQARALLRWPMWRDRLRRRFDAFLRWSHSRGWGGAELIWLGVALAIAGIAVVGLVGVCEDVIRHNGLSLSDPSRLRFVVHHRNAALDQAAKLASHLGGAAVLAALAAGAAVGLYWLGKPVVVAVTPGVALAVAAVFAEALKLGVGRVRPAAAFQLVRETSPSFPSGHSTDSAAFFLALGLVIALLVLHRRLVRVVCVALATAVAGAIGASRLVLGVHWPSDVIAGLLLGTIVAIGAVVACCVTIKTTQTDGHPLRRRAFALLRHSRVETAHRDLTIALA